MGRRHGRNAPGLVFSGNSHPLAPGALRAGTGLLHHCSLHKGIRSSSFDPCGSCRLALETKFAASARGPLRGINRGFRVFFSMDVDQ